MWFWSVRSRLRRGLARLASPSTAERCAGASALGRIGPRATEAYDPLLSAFSSDPAHEVRLVAGQALLKIARHGAATVAAAARGLDHPYAFVRAVAADLLLASGRAAIPHLPRLYAEWIRSRDIVPEYSLSRAVEGLLLECAPGDPEAVAAVEGILTNPAEAERRLANDRSKFRWHLASRLAGWGLPGAALLLEALRSWAQETPLLPEFEIDAALRSLATTGLPSPADIGTLAACLAECHRRSLHHTFDPPDGLVDALVRLGPAAIPELERILAGGGGGRWLAQRAMDRLRRRDQGAP